MTKEETTGFPRRRDRARAARPRTSPHFEGRTGFRSRVSRLGHRCSMQDRRGLLPGSSGLFQQPFATSSTTSAGGVCLIEQPQGIHKFLLEDLLRRSREGSRCPEHRSPAAPTARRRLKRARAGRPLRRHPSTTSADRTHYHRLFARLPAPPPRTRGAGERGRGNSPSGSDMVRTEKRASEAIGHSARSQKLKADRAPHQKGPSSRGPGPRQDTYPAFFAGSQRSPTTPSASDRDCCSRTLSR